MKTNYISYQFLCIMAVFYFVSCRPQSYVTKGVFSRCVELLILKSEYEDDHEICVDLPKGGKIKKSRTGNDKIFVEYQFVYSDSSIFYVRNDVWSISQVNISNLFEAGVAAYRKDHPRDTLHFSGNSNGRFWRESVLGNFTLGYVSPSETKMNYFDKAIRTVTVSENE